MISLSKGALIPFLCENRHQTLRSRVNALKIPTFHIGDTTTLIPGKKVNRFNKFENYPTFEAIQEISVTLMHKLEGGPLFLRSIQRKHSLVQENQ